MRATESPADRPETPMAHVLNMPVLTAADLQDSLLVAYNDLDRLHRLLGDAAATLMGHFSSATCQIKQLSGEATRHPGLPGSHLHETLQHLAGAVTALQFQDIASQLLAHTQHRLRRCTDQLARELMGGDEDGEAVVTEAPLRPNPVTQDEMDAGSIELF